MIVRMAFVGCVIGLVIGMAHTGVITPPMDPEAASLLRYAEQYSGYHRKAGHQPDVVYLSRGQLSNLMCGHPEAECAVEGVYFGGQHIYVLAGMAEPHRRSVIVHEFVHWLQRLSGQFPLKATCMSLQRQEREAYDTQNRYLKEVEHSTDFGYPPVAVCGKL